MNQGLIGKIFSWGSSPTYSDTTVQVWLYGLALVLILAFLWSTVVKQVLSTAAATV
jgi:hypothetical protein